MNRQGRRGAIPKLLPRLQSHIRTSNHRRDERMMMLRSRASSPSYPLEDMSGSSREYTGEHRARRPHLITTPSREDLISALPSHTIGDITSSESSSSLMLLNSQIDGEEQHATKIVREMEKDKALMEDNPFSEQLRLDTLREMPESLTLKRTIKRKLTKTVSQKSKHSPISFIKRMKYRLSMSASKFNLAIKNMLYSLELWYSSLKLIEGHYGSGVATYFKFFRWLFILNSIVFIVSLSFVVIPQILYRFMGTVNNTTETEQNSSLPEVNSDLFQYIPVNNLFSLKEDNSTLLFLVTQSSLATTHESSLPSSELLQASSPYSSNSDFTFGNIFTGEGFFTNTSLYYGYYTSGSLETISGLHYSVPMAYFFTALCSYLFIFLSLSVSMAKSYRKSFIETTGGLKNIYAHKIFCGWDFSIATGEAAHLKSKSIFNELRELLSEDAKVVEDRSCMTSFYIIVVQLSVNILSLIILVGTGTVMWLLLNANMGPDSNSDHRISMMVSLIVTLIMMVSPVLFSWLVRFEEYRNPRTSLYVTLFRTFVLEVVIIGVLVAFWLRRSRTFATGCWETSLGQEVYRLVLMDFLIAVVGTALSEFVRKRIYVTLWKKIGVPEFDIARNTLNLIYNQTLFFVGFFFSPLLSFIIVIKMFITFYIKKVGVLRNCQPSIRSWRAAQTQTLFLVLSFLSLLGVLITYGYILTQVEASDCGPFRGYTNMYQMILEGVFQLKQDHDFFKIIMFITKPGVVAGVLLAMCVGVYYLRAKSHAHARMVDILQEMLVLEAKDKEFLLSNISKVTEGMWIYNMRPGRHDPVSKSKTSVRYQNEVRFQAGDQPDRDDSYSSSFDSGEWILKPGGGSTTEALSTDSSRIGEVVGNYSRISHARNNTSSASVLPTSSSDDIHYPAGHLSTHSRAQEFEPPDQLGGRIHKLRRY